MGEDEYDPPIILGRPFLSTVKAIIYIGTREVHMHFPSEKVRRYFTDPDYIVEDSKQDKKKTTQPQPKEANHQGRIGRLQRRSGKVWRHTAWTELSWGDRSTKSGVEREDNYTEEEALQEAPTTPLNKSQDYWENGESRSEDLKTPNTLPRGKLGSYLFPFNYLK